MLKDIQELLFELCAVPAPSNHEEKRSAFVKKRLDSWGMTDAYIDDALNVIWPYHMRETGNLMICAHLDTVFPDMTPFSVRVEGDEAYCPGIGDDTANVAVLMYQMKRFYEQQPETDRGILFVLNTGEEGLGNLKGVRRLMKDFAGRIDEFVSLDGGPDALCTKAVGSHRYRIGIDTEGGHSFGAFGNRNAIEKMAKLIESLYEVKVPEKEGTRTTYNVGTITGGTSVNTIAQHAEMLYEYRSDDEESLAIMEKTLREKLAEAEKDCLKLTCERIGERPCGSFVEPQRQRALVERAARAAGRELSEHSGSTDCNIPLSLGIPSVCWGAYRGSGAHTYGEHLTLSSIEAGSACVERFLDSYIC